VLLVPKEPESGLEFLFLCALDQFLLGLFEEFFVLLLVGAFGKVFLEVRSCETLVDPEAERYLLLVVRLQTRNLANLTLAVLVGVTGLLPAPLADPAPLLDEGR